MDIRFPTLYVLATLVLAGCGGEPQEPAAPTSVPAAPPPVVDATPIAAASTDAAAIRGVAHRLAGLPLADGETSAAWTRHAELMDEAWRQVEERHLRPMGAFAEAHLGEIEDPRAPLFYPFSGPDLPSALQFFPEARTYVLVGLEPPGALPDLEGFGGAALEAELERLHGGMANLVEAGYFVTKRMEEDFADGRLGGLLPVLYLFLARAGLEPTAVRFVTLAEDGAVQAPETVSTATATAVKIELAPAGEAEAGRTLYYFSRDLSDPGLAGAPAFVAFLRGLGGFNAYMKSASYLLHMPEFARLKQLLLAEGQTILQDDSGVPLRDFSPELWRLRFFGVYRSTLPPYRQWFQEDLRDVFAERGDIPPLPFAIGYNSRTDGSCLIWARRRTEGSP